MANLPYALPGNPITNFGTDGMIKSNSDISASVPPIGVNATPRVLLFV
jgi:hypothetical protein